VLDQAGHTGQHWPSTLIGVEQSGIGQTSVVHSTSPFCQQQLHCQKYIATRSSCNATTGARCRLLLLLSPNQKQKNYERLFEAVKNLCNHSQEPDLTSNWQLFMRSRLHIATLVCMTVFFIYIRILRKTAQEGLLYRCNTDAEFSLTARMIVNLAFVPTQDLDVAVDECTRGSGGVAALTSDKPYLAVNDRR